MSSESPSGVPHGSSQPPVSLQFGNIETTDRSTSFAGYATGPIHFHSGQDPLDALPRAEGASFNSLELEHERLCLPGTRTNILKLIEQWRADRQGKRIFWLSGMAGTGKSAIARTLARSLSNKKQLGASFFFSRGRGDCGNASKFFTSIAYQLASRDTENGALAQLIRKAVKQNPGITTRAKRDQWKHLIQEPLSQMKSHPTHGIVFVIDALDECEDDRDVQLILKTLFEAKDLDHIQFRVFLTSRPSISVRDGFLETVYHSLILHDIEQYIVQQDLRIFFDYELKIIQGKYRLTGDFPGEGDIETLVQRAGELFIYATTICLFLGERKHPPPQQRLKIILQNNASAVPALKNLDRLYIQILQEAVPKTYSTDSTDSKEDKTEFCSHFRDIVGSIANLFSSLSVSSLATLLVVEKDDIDLTLDSLRSIINIPQNSSATISLIHPSFRDFLLDQKRCIDSDFRVNSAKTHVALTEACLNLMAARLKRDICDLKLPGTLIEEIDPDKIRDYIPGELEYACTYWVPHLESSLEARSNVLEHNLLDRIQKFLEQNILYWFEALSLLGKMQKSVLMLSTLLAMAQSYDNRSLVELVYDAYRFSLDHRFIIEQAPLQTYHSALIFSPSTSILRKLFESQAPYWVNCTSEALDSWGSLLQTLEGHKHGVSSVAFSPNGQQIASGSWDGTVRVWDTASGMPLHMLERDTHYVVASIAFSPDGQKLASGGGEVGGAGGMHIWDVMSGSLIQTFEGSHFVRSTAFSSVGQKLASGDEDGIYIRDVASGSLIQTFEFFHIRSVAFSPDGQKLVSASKDGAVRVWDVASGSQLQTFEGYLTSVLFSPDGQKLVSGSVSSTICVWDAVSGLPLKMLKGHTGVITSVAISGQKLASGSSDRTIRIWDLESGSLLQKFEGHSSSVASIAFSPNGQRLVSGSWDCAVRVWDVVSESPLQKYEGHPDYVWSVAFSPDGQKLACGSEEGAVYVWDVESKLLLHKFRGPDEVVILITFSPDGEKLACISRYEYGKIRVWFAVSGSELQMIEGAIDSTLEGIYTDAISIAFSPDGQKVAGRFRDHSNKIIERFWDVASGSQLEIVEGYSEWVWFSTDSTDNQLGALNVIDRWVTVNQKRMIWLPPARQASTFAINGTKIAIGSPSCTLTLLDLNLEQMDPFVTSPPSLSYKAPDAAPPPPE